MNNKFEKPMEVSDVDTIFPGNIKNLMPSYEDIPEEFKDFNSNNYFVKFQQKWFFNGVKEEDFPIVKKGIDKIKAARHLCAIQRSWQCKHEHKVAAVAYLMSIWFEEPKKYY